MKPTLLLVEDDRPVLAVMGELLKRTGCDLIPVASVAEAIAQLQHRKIDILVTDFFLGDHTAEEVIKVVRATQPSVPIIIVSGDVDSVPGWLKEPGVVEEIFAKPFSSPVLLRTITEALASSQPQPSIVSALLRSDDFRLPDGIEKMVHRVVDEESIVAITEKKGMIVYANDRFCEISGYSRTELLGQNHRLLKSGRHPPAFYKSLWGTILSGRTWRGEICNKAKDGHFYYVDTIISPLRTEGLITHFMALRTDITAKKELEKELAQQQQREEEDRRVTALGRMANGFLHDLTNILTGVMGIASEGSSSTRDAMLHDAIGRMAQLTRTLRDYSTGRPSKMEQFPLNPVVACACSLVRHRKGAPAGLSIVERLEETGRVSITGNEGQVFEIVLNLVVNAMEAVSDALQPRIVVSTTWDGHHAGVSVEDNGPGVPVALAPNIFEPYASSKGAGRGIGLSVAHSIAVAHNGSLELERAGGSGVGACFRLSLPAREVMVPWRGAGNESSTGPRRVILVSEDEPDVRRLIMRSAGEIGMTVMSAGDTADLLALAAKMKEVLAAAIIDSCEVESEQGAVACLRRIAPDLPIILISANLSTQGRSSTPWGEVENIPKPFAGEALVKALNESVSRAPFG